MGSLSDFEIVNPLESDLIQYKSGKWKNIRKEVISDGGNF
jgi:hypothetical protein